MDTPRSDLSACFADQLRAERAAKRMSRAELSSASGLSAKTIQRLEDNDREMNTDQLARLCRALEVSLVDFVRRAEERMSRPKDDVADVTHTG